MNKELEEVIDWLKNNIKYYQEQIKFIETTDCDYYDKEYELYKNRIKIFETILNYIENSIPKMVVEEKMVIDIDKLNHGVNGILSKIYKARIILEKELLEGK